jgi:glycosyltransferase involved in cell wall biosynthesis
MEALDAGRSAIVSDATPAVEDVMRDPANGLVVPGEDIDALASAMKTLLDRPSPDPAALADTVARYRIGAGADAYLDAFRKARG